MRDADAPALVAGIALIAFGAVLVADGAGAVSLDFATMAPIACAAVGAILLSLGLSRRP